MIRVASIALLVLSLGCASTSQCTRGSEFEPRLCPLQLPSIQSLEIEKNGAKGPAETDPGVACDGFRVDEDVVRRYLAAAKTTTANDAHHTLDWSPCYAAGSITFSDGRSGKWSVSQLRLGTLSFGSDEQIILYCPTCEFAPFQ